MVPDDSECIDRLVWALIDLGFEVRSWQDPVRPPVDPRLLRGRYYLRATRTNEGGSPLVLDATYESPLLPFDDAWRRRVMRGDLAVASREDLDRFRWPRGAAVSR
jgi:hypothetical protein